MSKSFEILQRHYQQREMAARKWKETGGKVIGYFCDSVPEELMLAADFFPLRISGNPWEDTIKADEANPLPSEAYVSSMLNGLLTGRYDFMDFLVIPRVRTSIHGLYAVLNNVKAAAPEVKLPEIHFMDFLYPHLYSHQLYNRNHMLAFKQKLEEWSGREITDSAISKAITITNENKALLKQVAALRAANPPLISGVDALQIIGSSMFMLKEEHNKLLKQYLEDAAQLPARKGVRIFVEGSPLDNLQLYEIIESCGAIVVGEDNCWGNRYAEVDRRGMGASFGIRRGYHDIMENKDAYDIAQWLASQPWSDGNIGVVGCSNMGEAALHAAIEMSPHVKAIFAGCYNWNKYDGFLRGGIRANWGAGPDRTAEQDLQSAPVDGDTDQTLLRQAVEQHRGNTSLRELWRNLPHRDTHSELTDSPFWVEGSLSTYQNNIEKTGVAIYTYGGWFDDFRTQGLVTLANLKNPGRILIGPWQHCGTDDFDIAAERRRFFDYWLKGIDNGILKEPPVYYYTINAPEGEAWRTADQWPLPNEQRHYLVFSEGKSNTASSINDGMLTIENAEGKEISNSRPKIDDKGVDIHTTDYSVACPPNWPILAQTCVLDDKGLTYTSELLSSDLEITGCPVAHIWMSSTAPDANLFTYLEDVDPEGHVEIITDGRLRASLRRCASAPYKVLGLPWHRSKSEDAEPLTPGEPTELVFDLLAISWIIKAGHRIRVTVTTADPREFERKEVSPPPEIKIYRDKTHPSHIDIPVIV